MKSSKRGFRGPKVQYFEHRHGIVNARKSLLRRTAPAMLAMMLLVGGVQGGLSVYRSYTSRTVSLHTTDVAGVSVQKELAVDSNKPKEPIEDKGLDNEIEKKIKTFPKSSKWSVAIRDLSSERMANVNTEQMHDSSDLYELFLLAPLESKLNSDSWKSRMGKMTTQACVETMIKQTEKDCGVLVGLRAEKFDDLSLYQTFILQPLIFLGGVFYSVSLLPEPFKTLTHFDPIYYMINTVRYSMLGSADVNPELCLGIIAIFAVGLFAVNYTLFNRGYKLRA